MRLKLHELEPYIANRSLDLGVCSDFVAGYRRLPRTPGIVVARLEKLGIT